MKLRDDQRVSYDTAKARALKAMSFNVPTPTASIADVIWPDHEMARQGAGAAASRILKKLEKEGLATWHITGDRFDHSEKWGWIKLPAARIETGGAE